MAISKISIFVREVACTRLRQAYEHRQQLMLSPTLEADVYVVYLTSHTYELTPPLVPTGRIGHYVLCRHFQCNIPSCHNIELNTPQLDRIFETVSELDFAIIHAAGEFHTMDSFFALKVLLEPVQL